MFCFNGCNSKYHAFLQRFQNILHFCIVHLSCIVWPYQKTDDASFKVIITDFTEYFYTFPWLSIIFFSATLNFTPASQLLNSISLLSKESGSVNHLPKSSLWQIFVDISAGFFPPATWLYLHLSTTSRTLNTLFTTHHFQLFNFLIIQHNATSESARKIYCQLMNIN